MKAFWFLISLVLASAGCNQSESQPKTVPVVRMDYIDVTPSSDRNDKFGGAERHLQQQGNMALDAAPRLTPGSLVEIYVTDATGQPEKIAEYHYDPHWKKAEMQAAVKQFAADISTYVQKGGYKVPPHPHYKTSPIVEDAAYLIQRASQLQKQVGGKAEVYMLTDGQQFSDLCRTNSFLNVSATERERVAQKIADALPIPKTEAKVRIRLSQARKEEGKDNHVKMIAFYDALGKKWGVADFKTEEFLQ